MNTLEMYMYLRAITNMMYSLIIIPSQEFLKKEFSDENIVFWIACENFRNITDFEEVRTTIWDPLLMLMNSCHYLVQPCVLGFWYQLFLVPRHRYNKHPHIRTYWGSGLLSSYLPGA